MFFMTNSSIDVSDLSDFAKFQKRVKFRAKLLKDIRGRLQKEYLQVQKPEKATVRTLKVLEVVLVENPNKKRLYWPLDRIIELIPSRIRILKLKWCKSVIIRLIQRDFPLEIHLTEVDLSNDALLEVESPAEVTSDPPSKVLISRGKL
ncbi:hypothetical protein AVEN_108754-1 [Araneus ventricosus]|uniref:DUF5641 domain-containing protein n=1 Tax=Araneus ventricosus TaxID=182803 RepID=A0A4Y2VZB3_ARAVE|nr:hypothetical protein AVEN_108754-1 [Araneus ventricosus]